MSLPPALAAVMVAFQPLFSKPVFERALVLAVGALLSVRARTVAAALRVTGRDDARFSAYHRVLSRAQWSCLDAACVLLRLVVERFVPEGPVIVGLDDTVERRWGARIEARGIYRDPVRSSHGHFALMDHQRRRAGSAGSRSVCRPTSRGPGGCGPGGCGPCPS